MHSAISILLSAIQVISITGFESPCSTTGESCRFSPLWCNGPRLHGGNPIGFVPASRGGVYIELSSGSHSAPIVSVGSGLVTRALLETGYHLSK